MLLCGNQEKAFLFELDGYWKCPTFDFKSVAQTSVRVACLASPQMRTAGVENNMSWDYLLRGSLFPIFLSVSSKLCFMCSAVSSNPLIYCCLHCSGTVFRDSAQEVSKSRQVKYSGVFLQELLCTVAFQSSSVATTNNYFCRWQTQTGYMLNRYDLFAYQQKIKLCFLFFC